jgi:GNAT superfamily N-acetyltransferase
MTDIAPPQPTLPPLPKEPVLPLGTNVRAHPSGWGAPDLDSDEGYELAWTDGIDDTPTLEGVDEWIVGPLDGILVPGVAGYFRHTVNGVGVDPFSIEEAAPLTAAGNPGQVRVPKGNTSGGEWMESAGGVAEGLERQVGNAHIFLKAPDSMLTIKPPPITEQDKAQIVAYTEAVERALQGTSLAGMPMKVEANKTSANNVRMEQVEQLRLQMKILNENETNTLFTLDRRLYPGTGEVKNEWMVVSPIGGPNGTSLQGQGIGSAVTAATDDALREMGYHTVRTQAGLNQGGYVWAKQGFAFDNEYGNSNASEVAGRVLGAAMGGPAQEQARDLLGRILRREPVLPAELAMVGWTPGATTWPGKEGMQGAWWNGIKDLTGAVTASVAPEDVAAYWYGWALTDPAAVDTDADEFLQGLSNLLYGGPLVVAAGNFNPGQIRVPKGNDAGGQWMDAARDLANGLEGAVSPELMIGADLTRVTNETVAPFGLTAQIVPMKGFDGVYFMRGKLYRDGVPVGTFERGVDLGDKRVANGLFELNDNEQGKGIGSALTAAWEDEYRKQGIEVITLTANIDVGGYTWARLGFQFDGYAEAHNAASAIVERFRMIGDEDAAQQAIEMIIAMEQDPSKPVLPADLARIGWTPGAEDWVGKQAMLNSEWEGVKYLQPSVTAAGAVNDPRADQIDALHRAWVPTARYESVPHTGPSQYPETEEDVFTHADSDTEYMTALVTILGSTTMTTDEGESDVRTSTEP